MRTLTSILLLVGFFLGPWPCGSAHAQVNDVAVTAVKPESMQRLKASVPVQISATVENLGSAQAVDVRLKVIIRNIDYTQVYEDSTSIPSLAPGAEVELASFEFVPPAGGFYQIHAVVTSEGDQELENNERRSSTQLYYKHDLAAIAILAPTEAEIKLHKTAFTPRGVFKSYSLVDEYDVSARVLILRCSDNALMFQADSLIPALPVDTSSVIFDFPSQHNNFDVRTLEPGCYTMLMIARHPIDGDRTNDTAISTFTINNASIVHDVATDAMQSISIRQRGNTLTITYSGGSMQAVNWRLFDVLGTLIRRGTHFNGHASAPLEIPADLLLSGRYIIELRSNANRTPVMGFINFVR